MPRRALTYAWYAEAYGWPQRVVDEEIGDEMYEWYPLIMEGKARAAELERKNRRNEGGQGRHAR